MSIRLVVFDVDGTLTTHNSIWWRLHQYFDTEDEGRRFYDQYFAGEIDYREWARLDARLWAGRRVDEVMRVVHDTELTPGARETVGALRNAGIHVAILSGGLDLLANNIARRLGIEFVLANHLGHRNGILTGDVDVRVGWGEKAVEIGTICNHFNVALDETAFIGDGKNDVSVFRVVGLAIAFLPREEEVAAAADVVVREEDLRSVLNHILEP